MNPVRHRVAVCAAGMLCASPLLGQVREGEVLVAFESGGGALRHYLPNGTFVAEAVGGINQGWIGAAITDSGTWVTADRDGFVLFFDPSGSQVSSFPFPEVDDLAGDVAVLSDGVLALVDTIGEVELYTEAGAHLATLPIPGVDRPFGLGVDAGDELWVADIVLRRIWHVARDGTFLGSIDVGDWIHDVAVGDDGTLWTRGYTSGIVRHFARDGTLLGGFPTVQDLGSGIAVSTDGSIWTTRLSSPARLRHHASDGTPLGDFPLPPGPNFLTVGRALGSRYCSPATANSTGSPGRLFALGSSFVAASDVTLLANDLPPGEFGYFLVGSNQGQFQPPGSQGTICLACSGFQGCAGIGRYNRVGEIVQGPTGSIAIDLTALPLTPPRAVAAGQTWNFQCWFRDLGSSNFTDAVSVTFR